MSRSLLQFLVAALSLCAGGVCAERDIERSHGPATAAPTQQAHVVFDTGTKEVPVFGYTEIVARAPGMDLDAPFRLGSLSAEVTVEGASRSFDVEGFCDDPRGKVFRVRIMPRQPGTHRYVATFRVGDAVVRKSGVFVAVDEARAGPLRVDEENPWHFIREDGSRFVWSGANALLLAGWDARARGAILDRYRDQGVNVVRCLLSGSLPSGAWGAPVRETSAFRGRLSPWLVRDGGGFDHEQFDLAYWRHFEGLLADAAARELVVCVSLFLGGQNQAPAVEPGSGDEWRYLRYAAARLSAFWNVVWDLGHEHDMDRTLGWADDAGYVLKAADPYDHLLGAHNRPYRSGRPLWLDVQFLQRWGEGQTAFLEEERRAQRRTGRIVPLVNAGYGYEDQWESQAGERNDEALRRLTWEILFAGVYPVVSESARRGTGLAANTGGGWINGRGDDTMKLAAQLGYARAFLERVRWWEAESAPDSVGAGEFCVSVPGQFYAVYSPDGGGATVRVQPGAYRALRFSPRSGQWRELPSFAEVTTWTAPRPPDSGDWAYLIVSESYQPDTEPPRLERTAVAPSGDRLALVFSEPVELSRQPTSHVELSHGVTIKSAHVDPLAPQVIRLVTSPLTPGKLHILELTKIRDRSRHHNAIQAGLQRAISVPPLPDPVLYVPFDDGAGESVSVEGRWSVESGLLTRGTPTWAGHVPHALLGPAALEFGDVTGPFAVDLTCDFGERAPRSLSFAAWINVRLVRDPKGHVLFSAASEDGASLAIVLTIGGAVQLECDGRTVASTRDALIASDLRAVAENWMYIAVSVRTESTGLAVQFFSGQDGRPATVESAVRAAGTLPALRGTGRISIGHVLPAARVRSAESRGFRGLMDDVVLTASISKHTGALDVDQIRALQNGALAAR